jgi:hypothetical protein
MNLSTPQGSPVHGRPHQSHEGKDAALRLTRTSAGARARAGDLDAPAEAPRLPARRRGRWLDLRNR